MKAAVLTGFGNIECLDVPEPEIGPDEALIKVAYSGVCGTDVHVSQGHHPAAKPPLIMGHEFSGTVEKAGTQNKKGLKQGQRVVVQPIDTCGVCELCITGRDNVCPELKIFGIHCDGSFAEYVKAPVQRVHPIGKEVDLKLAALTEPLAVALHDVRMSEMKVGQTVLVIGGGPIGMLTAAVARLGGASDILVTELNPFRKKLLTALGFDVFDPSEGDVLEEVRKRTAGRGYDRVFEVSGTKKGNELMLRAVKIGGTAMVVGIPTDKYPLDTDLIFKREIRIQGVRIHSQINFKDAVTVAAGPEIQEVLSSLVTHEFPLSALDKAVDLAQNSREVCKIIIQSV